MNCRMQNLSGFTLIELIAALAIAATLAAIAIPLYSQQVKKGHRTNIQTSMMDLSVRQTSWRANHTSYGTLSDLIGLSPSISDPTNSYYAIAVTATTTSFSITATPQGSQAADGCGTMSLNQSLSGTPANCW